MSMTSITTLSNRYVSEFVALSPLTATYVGIPGYDHLIDDLSPAGLDARNELTVTALQAISEIGPSSAAEEVARQVIVERLEVVVESHAAGYLHGALNVIESPLQQVRMAFDLMPTDSADDWEVISRRMAAVPAALRGYQESLLVGVARGVVSARRQVDKCARQCLAYAGLSVDLAPGESVAGTHLSSGGYFAGLAASAGQPGELGAKLAANAAAADSAYAEMAGFLVERIRPYAPELDAVGEQRYRIALREFTGADLDLAATYAWGWREFLAIEVDMAEVAGRITGGGTAAAAAAQLDADLALQLRGLDELRSWMQRISDAAIAELGRTHFQIAEPLLTLECLIAPPGGNAGAYYTGPSDDLSRPGRMWFSTPPGHTTFHPWRETTVIYHEGVPGHHLQVGTQVYQRARLNDFQRLLGGTSGHAEGWALYAERLVRELGYLDDPALLGMLNDQLFRAARVVLDIGMHLQLEIPAGTGFHEGERWTPELGLEFLLTRTVTEAQLASDEIDRYLGWPGQAPSYKVGERVWLEARAAARERHGETFDLKAFHTAALDLGGMGLDPLRALLDTL